eukprot:TRINITY_DN1651_c0_g1_i1.p1 TRINITY_DN1651_c0_g1~~TRINITY_DN1651_c0_g1_i1.p1  ORF type:complete len:800 (-),score=235.70 TRINITY_DN1651_c0_g1_i1:134-2509(-)
MERKRCGKEESGSGKPHATPSSPVPIPYHSPMLSQSSLSSSSFLVELGIHAPPGDEEDDNSDDGDMEEIKHKPHSSSLELVFEASDGCEPNAVVHREASKNASKPKTSRLSSSADPDPQLPNEESWSLHFTDNGNAEKEEEEEGEEVVDSTPLCELNVVEDEGEDAEAEDDCMDHFEPSGTDERVRRSEMSVESGTDRSELKKHFSSTRMTHDAKGRLMITSTPMESFESPECFGMERNEPNQEEAKGKEKEKITVEKKGRMFCTMDEKKSQSESQFESQSSVGEEAQEDQNIPKARAETTSVSMTVTMIESVDARQCVRESDSHVVTSHPSIDSVRSGMSVGNVEHMERMEPVVQNPATEDSFGFDEEDSVIVDSQPLTGVSSRMAAKRFKHEKRKLHLTPGSGSVLDSTASHEASQSTTQTLMAVMDHAPRGVEMRRYGDLGGTITQRHVPPIEDVRCRTSSSSSSSSSILSPEDVPEPEEESVAEHWESVTSAMRERNDDAQQRKRRKLSDSSPQEPSQGQTHESEKMELDSEVEKKVDYQPYERGLFSSYSFILTGFRRSDEEDDESAAASADEEETGSKLEKIIEEMDGEVLSKVTMKRKRGRFHTVLVADGPCRTRKFLCGLALGLTPLHSSWIMLSYYRGFCMDMTTFLIPRGICPKTLLYTAIPQTACTTKRSIADGDGIFSGQTIRLEGSRRFENLWQDVLMMGGAKISRRSKHGHDGILTLKEGQEGNTEFRSKNSKKHRDRSQSSNSISVDWIVSCLVHQTFLPQTWLSQGRTSQSKSES